MLTSKGSGTSAANRGRQNEARDGEPSEELVTIRLSNLGVVKRSPMDFELQIQSERIVGILSETISKLQMAVCLPRLIRRDACLLHLHMQENEVEYIMSVCAKYNKKIASRESPQKKSSLSQSLLAAIDKISLHDSKRKLPETFSYNVKELEFLVDPHMSQVMEMLWMCVALKNKVVAEFDAIPKSPPITFVSCMKNLRRAAETRLSMSAMDEKAREKQLNKAWKANVETEEHIEKHKQLLQKQREDLGRQVQVKKAVAQDYASKIQAMKLKFQENIKYTMQRSEMEMAEDTLASEARQTDLVAEAKVATQQYESLLFQHLAHEKGLRAKRFKVETQLCSWLAKYDADIGERHAEFEEITKGYEEERAEMDALQERFNEQEEEYVVLMAEKEEEERLEWERKAYVFLMNRAARKIQRCWRAYWQRKLERKKARKGRGRAKKQKSTEGSRNQ